MLTLQQLEGHRILGGDGRYLGVITANAADPDSIRNTTGTYGSAVSPTSLLNWNGPYGSAAGTLSAFNPVSVNPPRVVSPDGAFVIYLTKNPVFSPRMDPELLKAE